MAQQCPLTADVSCVVLKERSRGRVRIAKELHIQKWAGKKEEKNAKIDTW